MRVADLVDGTAERLGPPSAARPGPDAGGPADASDPAGGLSGDGGLTDVGGLTDIGGAAESPLHELLLASVPAPVLRSFTGRLLRPLWEYDDRHNAELLDTLRSFLACDGSWSACASLMYVHVNTVRYRISRIEALTGRDLSALADRVDFFLALRGA